MFGTQHLVLFVVAGLLLNMMPGPDSLLIITRSATQGWRAGSAAALGIGAGTLVHVFAAALGLSAALATSTTAFAVVKYVGAAYLLWIGIGLLRAKMERAGKREELISALPSLPYSRIFFQGLLTNVLNPKVAVFFLAFVPQFISPDASNKTVAFIALGLIFNFNGMLWCHFLAVSCDLASRRLQLSRSVALWLNRLVGTVFVSIGLKLAFSEGS